MASRDLVVDRHDEPHLPRQVEAVEVVCFGLENHPRFSGADMGHKYEVGQDVYYSPPVRHSAPPGSYKIVSRLPVELEGRLLYRIKSAVEKFERTADETDLSPAD